MLSLKDKSYIQEYQTDDEFLPWVSLVQLAVQLCGGTPAELFYSHLRALSHPPIAWYTVVCGTCIWHLWEQPTEEVCSSVWSYTMEMVTCTLDQHQGLMKLLSTYVCYKYWYNYEE